MAFRHLSWEQRQRRLRRRKQRRYAAAAVTIAGGQLAWMAARDADPAGALEASRSNSLQSFCDQITTSCPTQSFQAPGGVTDVAVSDDGDTVAFITSAALLQADTDAATLSESARRDVYVRGPGGLRLLTGGDHPGGGQFWTVGSPGGFDFLTEVAISGDGRHVTWTMTDDSDIIFFLPAAIPVDEGSDDPDFDSDVFVATVDADGDGFLDTAAGPPLLASVDANEANLSRNAIQPSISRDGRFIAFTHFLTGQPTPSEVVLHDRDADGNGVFDEAGAGQTSSVVNPGTLAPFSVLGADEPEVSANGDFVAFRAYDLLAPSSTGLVRVWRRSDNTTFEATAGDFTGGIAGTRATWPTISADGTTVAYDFEVLLDTVVTDIPIGRNQTVVVDVDPGVGSISNPYIASQDPTNPDPTSAISDSSRESFPSLSEDGRYVVYQSNADNVAGHLGSGDTQVYAVDLLQADPVDRVPVIVSAVGLGGPGDEGDDGSFAPDVSANGAVVAFVSSASNLATFPTITADPNAFVMQWQVDVEAESSVTFPDTSVGATSAPLTVTFTTDDFGPWFSGGIELLDAYVDPATHDYTVLGDCSSPFGYHANDPCSVQVTFAPIQDGNRLAELCVVGAAGFGCETTAIVGGQALVPDGPGPIVLESLTDDDEPLVLGAEGGGSVISADGRFIAFVTSQSIDPADENGLDDVYVRDRFRGTTTLISTGAGLGPGGSESSEAPTISGDGRFIAFESRANKVTEPDGEDDGGWLDVFLVDRGDPDANGDYVPAAATMTLISLEPDGTGLFADSHDASISGDGTQAAFTVAGGEGDSDVFVWDRFGPLGPRTIDVSNFVPTTVDDTFSPAISADGGHVAFVGETFITEGTFGAVTSDIVYVFDRDSDQDGIRDEPAPDSRVVAVTSPTFTPLGDPLEDTRLDPLQSTDSSDPAISGDGSTVAYAFEQFYNFNDSSTLENMQTPLPFGTRQIIVVDRDVASGGPLTTELVSLAGPGDPNAVTRRGIPGFDNIAQNAGQCLSGAEGCGSSYTPDLSDDGRYVTFATEADNLVVDPASSLPGFSFCGDGGACDIVAVDRIAPANGGGPQHVNQPPGPVLDPATYSSQPFADRQVFDPAISADGRFITFSTEAEYFLGYQSAGPTTGFVEPVDDNSFADVYLREWQPVVDASPPVVFPDTPLGATSVAQPAVLSTQDFGPAPIQSWTIIGANAGDFAWVDQQNCLPVAPPPPPIVGVPPVPVHGRVRLSSNCSLFVAFTPTAVGPRNAVLQVVAGVDPFSVPGTQAQVFNIPLTGGGAGQGGFTAQPSVDLGSQIVTTTSPEGTVTVTNTGNLPFQITNVAVGGTNPGDFAIVDATSCIGFLAPGASCTVRLTFTPTAPGERSATLVFTDTAPGGPHAVGLTGRAPLPTLIVNPGVTVPGRTVQIQGLNWAPNQIVVLTTADANNPTRLFPGSTEFRANAFGGIDGSVLFFSKTPTGPRIVIATGTPPTLSAFQPLLISVATINGLDFVTRG